MTDTDRIIIGVMGASSCDEAVYEQARDVGRLIAARGAVLLCGGRGGVMEGAARGAYEAGGLTLGILKGLRRAEATPNPYIHIALRTGLGDARNYLNIAAADAVIALDGEWGTLSEIALAMKIAKPLVLLGSWRWTCKTPISAPPTADTPAQAVAMAFDAIAFTRDGP